jgi:hypothetical protein
MKKIVLAAVLVALSSGAAHAATATGSATATIVTPIAITHVSGATLDFGTFDAGTGGSVSVTQGGVGSVGGGVLFVSGNANSADAFDVTGEGSRAFNISTTGGTVSNGSATMAFTTSSPTTGTLSSGAASFNVGGSLTVAAGQAIGTYTGSYSATVVYQ